MKVDNTIHELPAKQSVIQFNFNAIDCSKTHINDDGAIQIINNFAENNLQV